MTTEISIEGNRFLINGQPTYAGVSFQGKPVEGLLFNSRMVQAIFDDENPDTALHWRYPDTGRWDPERNTDEFCAMLPEYRRHGLLAVTVGLQGGGSNYEPEIYDNYVNTAFAPDGSLKPSYFRRLERILAAADAAGMVVIVNFFYWRMLNRLAGDPAILRGAEEAAYWLLQTGYRNLLIDVMNEFNPGEGLLKSAGIHSLIQTVQAVTQNGRRLLVGSSTHPWNNLPPGPWQNAVDFYLPHGNDAWAAELREQLKAIRQSEAYLQNPRPILINEDSIHLSSLDAAFEEYVSWGYYSQGYGCGGKIGHGRFDWLAHGREAQFKDLSGYQTVPVNWGINTAEKRAFFDRVAEITGSR